MTSSYLLRPLRTLADAIEDLNRCATDPGDTPPITSTASRSEARTTSPAPKANWTKNRSRPPFWRRSRETEPTS